VSDDTPLRCPCGGIPDRIDYGGTTVLFCPGCDRCSEKATGHDRGATVVANWNRAVRVSMRLRAAKGGGR